MGERRHFLARYDKYKRNMMGELRPSTSYWPQRLFKDFKELRDRWDRKWAGREQFMWWILRILGDRKIGSNLHIFGHPIKRQSKNFFPLFKTVYFFEVLLATIHGPITANSTLTLSNKWMIIIINCIQLIVTIHLCIIYVFAFTLTYYLQTCHHSSTFNDSFIRHIAINSIFDAIFLLQM